MKSILDLILYKHRRFKGQTYLKHHFPWSLIISIVFSIFLTNSYADFFICLAFFLTIDAVLAIAAWLYYPSDL